LKPDVIYGLPFTDSTRLLKDDFSKLFLPVALFHKQKTLGDPGIGCTKGNQTCNDGKGSGDPEKQVLASCGPYICASTD